MSDVACTFRKSNPMACGIRAVAIRLLGLALVAAASGCGPVEVRSAPPGTELDGLAVDGETLVLRVIIDNRNDVPMTIAGSRLGLTLDSIELEGRDWPLDVQIGPRGREAIDLQMPASGAALGLLGELDAGGRASLRYRLEGQLQIVDSRDIRVRRDGFLHPVPGRPGRYR